MGFLHRVFLIFCQSYLSFLVACTWLDNLLWRSVRRSVGRQFVCWSNCTKYRRTYRRKKNHHVNGHILCKMINCGWHLVNRHCLSGFLYGNSLYLSVTTGKFLLHRFSTLELDAPVRCIVPPFACFHECQVDARGEIVLIVIFLPCLHQEIMVIRKKEGEEE